MSNTIIFTEIVNCAPVGRIMLESFHKYHDRGITVFCSNDDYVQLKEFHHLDTFLIIHEIEELFKKGHAGTARVFAHMFHPNEDNQVIHLDSDLVFKKESISLIENAFDEGYDIVGSRRCYKNNPGKVPVPDGIPDAVSTYFFGMKTKVLPNRFSFEQMCQLWQGHNIGLDHPVLDFADGIYFHCLKNGAKTKFLQSHMVGGQNEAGSKTNVWDSNLHVDMGVNLMHCGGAGSGYAVEHGLSQPEKSYANWSRGRWALFSKLFYNQETGFNEPTKYNEDGRWVSGTYDDNILNTIKEELNG